MTKFKYLLDDISYPWEFNKIPKYDILIQLEIAYQLKRIADKLNHKVD